MIASLRGKVVVRRPDGTTTRMPEVAADRLVTEP